MDQESARIIKQFHKELAERKTPEEKVAYILSLLDAAPKQEEKIAIVKEARRR